MNFLAHLYLSKENPNIMIGNFIADQIPGNRFDHYHNTIQQGIRLHREIDTFTDAHAIVRKSKRRLHERYKHYDGVIIDVFYDHFLAKNWGRYSAIPLDVYAQGIYDLLDKNFQILPEKTQHLLPYMKKQNWLLSYASFKGIEAVLNGINKRTKYKSQMHLAITDLHQHYLELENDFTAFFEELQSFSNQILFKISSVRLKT